MSQKQQKSKRMKFFKYLIFVLFLVSFLTLGLIFFLDVMPFKYFGALTFVFLVLDFLMMYFLLGRGWKKRFIGTIFTILLILLFVVILVYLFNTYHFLNKIRGGNYNTENYSVVVLKKSNYNRLKHLKEKDMGIISLEDNEGLVEAQKYINKKIEVHYKTADDFVSLVEQLISEEVDAILIEDAKKKILEEENPTYFENTKVIYQFSIDVEIKDDLVKNVDITNAPFNIYISGMDSYGKITSVSRSDVNMVITVNPVTHKILVTSIPRDYYVKLYGIDSRYKDKLTHAGTHGIDTSIKTIEDLLSIDINYYVKVNFTSLLQLVDELGGIDVELDQAFRAFYDEDGTIINYSFKKGSNHLNGKQALAFARERKSLASGDVARIHHQQLIIDALFKKVMSKNIIVKYNDILKALENRFVTNLGSQNITKLVKYQLNENPEWEINKNILSGTNGSEYTDSYKSLKSYVMIPDSESIHDAKVLIQNVIDGA